MSSGVERDTGWRLSLGLTGWFLLIFVLTSVALYLATSHLIQQAMAHDWSVNQSHMEERITEGGGVTTREIRLTRDSSKALPSPAMQATIKQHFDRFLPLVLIPVVLVGIAGGLFLTYRSTRPLSAMITTVREILRTGESSRRVPPTAGAGPLREATTLFNRLLDRNEALLLRFRESLDHVAHDLRTPMTRLRATAESALGEDGDKEACRQALTDCMEESEQVLDLLNGLMDLAEAEAGAMRLDLSDVDVAPLVESVRELYELVAEEREARVDVEVEKGLHMRADAGRLRQALANLLDNAIKYGGHGVHVTLRAQGDDDEIRLEVRDDGPGIPPEDLPRIFDRLYRGDRSRHERGLGLGLGFVKAIAEAHGGTVDVESAPGPGSVFTLRLPLHPASSTTA